MIDMQIISETWFYDWKHLIKKLTQGTRRDEIEVFSCYDLDRESDGCWPQLNAYPEPIISTYSDKDVSQTNVETVLRLA